MTATNIPRSTTTILRDLDCKRTSLQILKTPKLRREVRNLEIELRQARLAFNTLGHNTGGKRRRGRKLAKLVG